MKNIGTILLIVISLVLLLLKNKFKQPYYLKVVVNHSQQLQLIVDNINSKKYKPAKARKPKKFEYKRLYRAYPYDHNDVFAYDFLPSDNDIPEHVLEPILIIPFMGGHSQSQCIRRMVVKFHHQHDIYILMPRGVCGQSVHPLQKKFRALGCPDDLNSLLGLIEKPTIIIGYSVGCIQACKLFEEHQPNTKYVQKMLLAYQSHVPSYQTTIPKKYQRKLSQPVLNVIQENKEFFINQGISQETLDLIQQEGTIGFCDNNLTCKLLDMNSSQEYYDSLLSSRLIPHISKPTLFVSIQKDLIAGSEFPAQVLKENGYTNFIQVNKGYHLGLETEDGEDLLCKLAEGCITQIQRKAK